MNCKMLGHLWIYDKGTMLTKCGYCKKEYKPKPLSFTEKTMIMLVVCCVFFWIGWNADEIVVWWMK